MKSERITDSEEHISEAAITESASSLVGPGAVLMVVRSGILKHTIPVAINDVEVALNQDMKAIRFAPDTVTSEYFIRCTGSCSSRLRRPRRAYTRRTRPRSRWRSCSRRGCDHDYGVEQLGTRSVVQQFANSPDLNSALLGAIMAALDAHNSMSSQALASSAVRDGLKDILLNHAQLYESLKAAATAR